MEILLGLIVFGFGVLQIILFFKIWGMTNNVQIMTQQLGDILKECRKINPYTKIDSSTANTAKANTLIDVSCDNINTPPIDTGFKIGDLVVDKNENQWRVVEINAPIIRCKNSTKGVVEFDMTELRLF